MGTRKPTK
uniref:Uncharacterized protein n=1 Tax=Arundo donax TaxID=35708 RepID=A0A0A9AFJ1_ARUDO